MKKTVVLYDCDSAKTTIKISKEELSKALERSAIQELIKTKSWGGELGSPLNPTTERMQTINPLCKGFIILKYWWEENKLMGELELKEDKFEIFKININDLDTKYRFVPRGFGTKNEDGTFENVIIICFDLMSLNIESTAVI